MTSRIILFSVILFFKVASGIAQTNATEAKAAYLLAEESYGKGDMKSTLEYLEDASVKLGSANAKILYLKIIAERELANKDTAYISKLASSINNFEKAPDSKDFNEDKTLEVVKIKLQLNKELAQKKKAEQDGRLIEPGLKAFALAHAEWPIGASLYQLVIKHPAMFPLKKEKVGYSAITTQMGIAYTFLDTKSGITQIYLKNDHLVGYVETQIDIDNDDANHSKGNEAFTAALKNLTEQLVAQPVVTPSAVNNGEQVAYSWQAGQKFVTLTKQNMLLNGMRLSKVFTFFYYPD